METLTLILMVIQRAVENVDCLVGHLTIMTPISQLVQMTRDQQLKDTELEILRLVKEYALETSIAKTSITTYLMQEPSTIAGFGQSRGTCPMDLTRHTAIENKLMEKDRTGMKI